MRRLKAPEIECSPASGFQELFVRKTVRLSNCPFSRHLALLRTEFQSSIKGSFGGQAG